MASTYESTPAEIKIAILNQIPHIDSLQALTHACPTMHALYIQNRELLLTQVTLKELRSKKLDVFTSAPLLEVRMASKANFAFEKVVAGLRSLRHHIVSYGEVRDDLVLSVEQCIALRSLVDAVPWRWHQYNGSTRPIYSDKPSNKRYTVVVLDVLPLCYQCSDPMTPNKLLLSHLWKYKAVHRIGMYHGLAAKVSD